MRIVHIDTGVEMRGGQRQVVLLLEGLEERGYKPVLLANARGSLFAAAQGRGWEVGRAQALEVWRQARAADVLHAHDARAHTMGAAVAGRTPLVVSRRVAFPVRTSWMSRRKYERADAYLAVSRAVANELQRAGVRAERIALVPDGVRETNFAWRWDAEAPVVALGLNDPAKGGALLRESARLAEGIPIVCSRDLEADLQRARAFVYISRSEGMGSAALLAMSMGIPVIASRVGGMAEIFEHNVSGLYVKNTAPEIAAAIGKLGRDRELAERLGSAGRARVRECFNTRLLVEKTVAVYGSVQR